MDWILIGGIVVASEDNPEARRCTRCCPAPVSPGPGPVLAPWMGLSSCPPSLDIDQFSVTSLDVSQQHQESHTRAYQQLN